MNQERKTPPRVFLRAAVFTAVAAMVIVSALTGAMSSFTARATLNAVALVVVVTHFNGFNPTMRRLFREWGWRYVVWTGADFAIAAVCVVVAITL